MLNNVRVGVKLAIGFGSVLVMLCAAAIVAHWALTGLEEESQGVLAVNRLVRDMLRVIEQEKKYVITGEEEVAADIKDKLEALKGDAQRLGTSLANDVHKNEMRGILNYLAGYKEQFDRYHEASARRKEAQADMLRQAKEAERLALDLMTDMRAKYLKARNENASIEVIDDLIAKRDTLSEIVTHVLNARRQEKEFILTGEQGYADQASKNTAAMVAKAGTLLSRFKSAQMRQAMARLEKEAKDYQKSFQRALTFTLAQKKAVEGMFESGRSLQAASAKVSAEIEKTMVKDAAAQRMVALIISAAAILVGLLLSFFISRSITKPLNRIIDALGAGAEQVASASTQVSSSSQSLAEGASEQAAALEETSASLEEMSSMIRTNADNAGQADSLMREAKQTVIDAGQAMAQMAGSMEQIAELGGETGKIVKSIDEIAFQTNLLALNAAVEAARAGEAGAGFAVVADEVRNLAMRAAEAAKGTQALVDDMVNRIGQGSDLVAKTQDGFKEVTDAVNKVSGLVTEIAAASSEQAQGVDQINIAMGQLDQVTQGNASSAEESASASEEMSAQAEVMKDMVDQLMAVVGGANGDRKKTGGSRLRWVSLVRRQNEAGREVRTVPRQIGHEVSPDKVIPLDEDDLHDF